MIVRATARLQFHRDFPLDRATELVPYFARLGISHVYASPLLMSRPGSTHGYDIVDHNRIDPELGGEPALERLVTALRAHSMGLVLDIVPNHMGVGGADNQWWLDVLEWGRLSRYAEYFDIDWETADPALRNKLLAPFLGDAYGTVLAAGDLRLGFDPADGRFVVTAYGSHRFPIAPRDYPIILRMAGGALDELIPPFLEAGGGREAMRRRAEAGRAALRDAHGADPAHFGRAVDQFDPTDEAGRERLHRLMERQAWRLCWWRAAADEINWRRFFDINGLAGVRVERPEVFEDTHALILRLYRDGMIDGVRVDHVDGLADPRGYCRKLRRRLESLRGSRPEGLRETRPIVWVEKILFAHESLATDWLTDGTTGYDFMNEVGAVLHDPAGEAELTRIWTEATGRPGVFDEETRPARRQILRVALSSELNATAAALHRIVRRNIATRDWSLTSIRRVLEDILVHFHTYRIYAGPAGASAVDEGAMAWAVAGARRTVRSADLALLDLVRGILMGEGLRAVAAGPQRQDQLRAMVRFQQLSAPVAAKSVEDTAFYRFGRLLSRNEVGTEPSQFALSPAGFHAAAAERGRRLPRALLATATHDHKRGEDTRMRLAVLSEMPDQWATALTRWTRLNAAGKRDVDGELAPDAADELMLYQTLVSAWPLDLSVDDAGGLGRFRERVAGWQEKSVREAKRHSEWAAPNASYESACRDFLGHCMDPTRTAGVMREIAAFADSIAAAGAANGLAQTLLRLTAPGVPDLYQGCEFWDFSLVDPDNRRPVDWAARIDALEGEPAPSELLGAWRDGRVKQAIIVRTLALRLRSPNLFANGSYVRLQLEGPAADHALAFARVHGGRAIIVAVGRALAGAVNDMPLAPAAFWDGTSAVLPRNLAGMRFTRLLDATQTALPVGTPAKSRLKLSDLFSSLPVALLEAG